MWENEAICGENEAIFIKKQTKTVIVTFWGTFGAQKGAQMSKFSSNSIKKMKSHQISLNTIKHFKNQSNPRKNP